MTPAAHDEAAEAPPVAPAPAESRPSLVQELLVPGVLLAFAAYLLIGILTMRIPSGTSFPGPRFFPSIVVALVTALSVLQIVIAVRQARSSEPPAPAAEPEGRRFDRISLLWVLGGFLGFTLLLDLLGWVIGAGLLFWCVARAFGSRRAIKDLLVGLTVSSVAYIGFDMLLGLSLPSGLLGLGA